MKQHYDSGLIYLPPRCPQCKADTPNTIEDPEHQGLDALLQCRACGHLWERTTIKVTNITLEYKTVMVPIERKRLNEGA